MYDDSTKQILIIEDDQTFRNPLRDFLSGRSFTVFTADDGEQAMEKILVHKPHLVILDLLLPKVHGFEVLKRIRSYPDESIAHLPVVVLTNLSSQLDIDRAKELKAEAYLVKSHTTNEEVLKKVKELLFGSADAPTHEVLDFRDIEK